MSEEELQVTETEEVQEEAAPVKVYTYEEFVDLLERNPSYEPVIFNALRIAQVPTDRAELAEQVEVYKKKTCLQTPQQILSLMVKFGAVTETIMVDGKPYEGTPEQFQEDEEIPDEAEISYVIETTEIGRKALIAFGPSAKITKLLESAPEEAPIFMRLMNFMNVEGGKRKADIEAFLNADDEAVRRNPKTGIPTIYPVYYITALEDAGAISWSGVWSLTDAGRLFLS